MSLGEPTSSPGERGPEHISISSKQLENKTPEVVHMAIQYYVPRQQVKSILDT